jgi:hypothetical protein
MKIQRIDCKTCGGKVRLATKKSVDVPGHIELIANCHGMWHVDIVRKHATATELIPFFRTAESMAANMDEARRIYGPPPGRVGARIASVEVRKRGECDWIVDELDKDGGWVAQATFADEPRAQAYASQRRQDMLSLKEWEA